MLMLPEEYYALFLSGVCAAASTILVVAIAKFSMHNSLLFALLLVSINDEATSELGACPPKRPRPMTITATAVNRQHCHSSLSVPLARIAP